MATATGPHLQSQLQRHPRAQLSADLIITTLGELQSMRLCMKCNHIYMPSMLNADNVSMSTNSCLPEDLSVENSRFPEALVEAKNVSAFQV